MICDARTCAGCQYLKQDGQDDQATGLAEFLANCQHAKCKVVRLVRQQISKLQSVQYERFLSTGDARDEGHQGVRNETPSKMYEAPYSEVHEVYNEVHEPYSDVYKVEGEVQQAYNEAYEVHEAQRAIAVSQRTVEVKNAVGNTATASLRRITASPGRAVDRKWMLRVLDRVRHRAQLILAAVAVGVIVWTALVYGVFLGATACGNGRTCSASSLKYMHAKRSLF